MTEDSTPTPESTPTDDSTSADDVPSTAESDPAGQDDEPGPTARPGDRDAFTITPEMAGADADDVDYLRPVEEFGAEPLSDRQVRRLPDHPMVRRRVFYAGRGLEEFLAAAEAGQSHSIVTGVGPSGPMHLGHVLPFYLAKRIQDETGATVYIPLSDDEKYFTRDRSFEEIGKYTRENLRDVLAVGFDPDRTRILIDTADADLVYPVAARVARYLTQSTVEATYGSPGNVGESFYPAVQATHLLLPQLVEGAHPTLVPIAVDQDPHVRLARDVAGTTHVPAEKPGGLLGKFVPDLSGPGKMASSDDAPTIELDDDPERVAETIRKHAYSGGRSSVAAHREHGGDPETDVAFLYLAYFFEESDAELERIAREYRAGELLSGELKELAIERITDFLESHRARRPDDEELSEKLAPYRLTDAERRRALEAAGVPGPI
jgi:tryptophanyl-tRNA synthetase